MTQRVQIRRNIDNEIQKFIGEPGELIYNLTTKRLHTNDGATIGGHPLALLSEVTALQQTSGIMVYRKSGNGVTTAFTVSSSVAAIEFTQVYLNGIYQQKDTYNVVSNGTTTTFLFATAPIAGTNNIEIVALAGLQLGQPSATTLSTTYSGNGVQLTFQLPASVPHKSNTQVYINGVYQQKTTYDISDLDLTFSEAPPVGSNNIEVVIIATATINSGITAARPGAVAVGFQYFDTSLKKPVYWDGIYWRDSAGNLA